MIGQSLGQYRIVEQIGAGGMGVVYRAHDDRLDRDVALKVLPAGVLADEASRRRFRREALALAKLNHPNIESVYEFDTQDGVDFLVMEYVPGATLSEKLAAGPLPEKELLRSGTQLVEGLVAAHEQGVVHRDLKPANLRLTPDGRLKILDFGLARLLQPTAAERTADTLSHTQLGAAAGTLPYMAPEQVRGEPVDARTDIWGAGAVLYEMATGQRPHPETEALRLSAAILEKTPRPPSELNRRLSPTLEGIILKALEKDPEHRYQSAKELRVDLERLRTGTSSASVRAATAGPQEKGEERWRRWWIIVPVAAMALGMTYALVSDYANRLPGRETTPRVESLAVLPLENLSRDPEEDYFVDGMTEALIGELAQISGLKVISRTSVMHYKGASKPLREIARDLGVDAVVEGSVQRFGKRVRIRPQLVHAATDQVLWTHNYERDLSDVLTLQTDVARAIATNIRVKLTPQEQNRLAATRPIKPEVHELYLKGRFFWNKRTEEGLRKSIEYFNQAIENDPGAALAYAGLADSYTALADRGLVPVTQAFPQAEAAAAKAIQLDETLAEAYAALAAAKLHQWDWSGSEKQWQRAIELNPGYAHGHHWHSHFLMAMGRAEESLAAARRALELDPLDPIINVHLGWVHLLMRNYDAAIEQQLRVLEMDPNMNPAYRFLAQAYGQRGRHREAISALEKAVSLSPRTPVYVAELGCAYALAGKRAEAEKTLAQLRAEAKQRYVPPFEVALIYVALGKKEQAFHWLNRAVEERSRGLLYLKSDPGIDPLRSDPRFQDLLRRVGLPP